jgi:uncharacterized protein (TIGR02271 family)
MELRMQRSHPQLREPWCWAGAARSMAEKSTLQATELTDPNSSTNGPSDSGGPEVDVVLPVVREVATVGKRRIDTGRGVRVTKTVLEHQEIVDEPLERDELVVERVVIDRVVDSGQLPSARQEGDVTIVPVLEEVIVTQKRIILKEELRITRVRRTVRDPQRVSLRREKVTAEEFDEDHASRKPAPGAPAEPAAGDHAGDNRPME